VVVTNTAGSATSNEATLTVNASSNNPPAVAITGPVNGAVYTAEAWITISASASDADERWPRSSSTQDGVAGHGHHVALQLRLEGAGWQLQPDRQGNGQPRRDNDQRGGDGEGLPVVTVSAYDAWASEPATDTGRFRVYRSSLTTAALTVKYAMSGTAVNGTDYAALSGSVVIPVGAGYVDVTVTPADDTLVEGKEFVTMTLSADAAYVLGTVKAGTVNLLDNELPVVTAPCRTTGLPSPAVTRADSGSRGRAARRRRSP